MSYWQNMVGARATRRRVLAATGMGTAAAAFLAACGGGSDSDNKSGDGKSVNDKLFKPADTSKTATAGGTWQRIFPGTLLAANVDPYALVGLNTGLALHVHSRMFQYKPTVYPEVPTTEVAPDAAESYEVSPDKLTVTFKLKGDVKFDTRAPTNGRTLTADDVVFSWNRFAAQSPNRKDMVNSLSPFGPVLSATNPDSKTVVFKLAFPYVPIVGFLAYPRYGQIQPKEADGGFNPQIESRGSGPWRIDRFEKDVELRFVRNPEWSNKGKPFFDVMSYKFLPEYATVLSQFRTGAIWEYHGAGGNSLIRGDDVLPLKRDVPKLNMIQTPAYQRTANVIFFSGRPESPWKDARVRQAASMLLDRDLILDTIFATKTFTDAGLPADKRWHTHIPAGEALYWEDPKTGAFGPSSKSFKRDPAAAKALMKAAGYTGPLKQPWTISTHTLHDRYTPIFAEMMMEFKDFEFDLQKPPNIQQFQNEYISGDGKFTGVTSSITATYPDVDGLIMNNYGSAGGFQVMTFTDDKTTQLSKQQRSEYDASKRKGLILDLAHHLGDQLFNIPFPGDVLGYNLAWPQLGNYMSLLTHSSAEAVETWPYYWYDKSKE
jgi:ABC-type transport system substrate-binding protein